MPEEVTNTRISLSREGILVLGAPLGSNEFISEELGKINEKHFPLLKALIPFSRSDHSAVQKACLILRYCAAPRLTYWLRQQTQRGIATEAAEQHDQAIIKTQQEILSAPQLPQHAIHQLQLPLRLGGHGLISAAKIQDCAFLGSVAITAKDIWERFSGSAWMPQGGEAAFLSLPWLASAASSQISLNSTLPNTTIPTIPQLLTRTDLTLQRRLSHAIHERDRKTLYDSLPPGGRQRAVLLSTAGPSAHGWLSAIPSEPRKTLNNLQYRTACFLTLGLALPQSATANNCICGARLDSHGDHFFCCHRGPERNIRHDILVGLFRKLLAEVGVRAHMEMPLQAINIAPPNAASQRMDLYCVLDDGVGHCLDVTVTHPARPDQPFPSPSRRTWDRENHTNGEWPGGQAAAKAEQAKRRTYEAAVRNAGHRLIPLAAETFGRWGKDTQDFLRLLARRRRLPLGVTSEEGVSFREGVVGHFTQVLSVGLMKWNAYQIASRAHNAAEAEGPAYSYAFPEDLVSRGPYRPHSRIFRAR